MTMVLAYAHIDDYTVWNDTFTPISLRVISLIFPFPCLTNFSIPMLTVQCFASNGTNLVTLKHVKWSSPPPWFPFVYCLWPCVVLMIHRHFWDNIHDPTSMFFCSQEFLGKDLWYFPYMGKANDTCARIFFLASCVTYISVYIYMVIRMKFDGSIYMVTTNGKLVLFICKKQNIFVSRFRWQQEEGVLCGCRWLVALRWRETKNS